MRRLVATGGRIAGRELPTQVEGLAGDPQDAEREESRSDLPLYFFLTFWAGALFGYLWMAAAYGHLPL